MSLQSNINNLFHSFNLSISNFDQETEELEYKACNFLIDNKKVIYRQGKTTPKKQGQFVTFWKRIKNGETQSF